MSRYTSSHVRTAALLLDMVPEDRHLELAELVPAVTVVLWWRSRGGRASAEAFADRFNVSRATAFRWRAALKGTREGVALPRLPGCFDGSLAPLGAGDARATVGADR